MNNVFSGKDGYVILSPDLVALLGLAAALAVLAGAGVVLWALWGRRRALRRLEEATAVRADDW